MRLPAWIRPPEATVADHEAQLDAARDALTAAEAAITAAVVAFDAEPTPAHEKAVFAAQDAEKGARLQIERAERLLAAAKEREAAEHRAQLEAERDQLKASLDPAALKAERAADQAAEVAAIRELVRVRSARFDVEQRIQRRTDRLRNIRVELGEQHAMHHHYSAPVVSTTEIEAALQADKVAPVERDRMLVHRLLSALKGY